MFQPTHTIVVDYVVAYHEDVFTQIPYDGEMEGYLSYLIDMSSPEALIAGIRDMKATILGEVLSILNKEVAEPLSYTVSILDYKILAEFPI